MKTNIRDEVLKKIKPTPKEHEKRVEIVKKTILKLEDASKNIDVEFFIGGSFGKNTYLKTSSDVDIFARFDNKYENDQLSDILKKILDKTGLKYKKQKGSRDYYSCVISKVKFEIVPNRKIEDADDMVNSTDVSPLHVEFLKSKIKNNKDLCDEIRLAKQFFKSKKLYGAESYVGGISGHVIDILIAHFGSLEKLLLDIKEWGEAKIIDINKFYKNDEEAKNNIEKDKCSKLIVIDPILKTRNAARALSDENYSKLLVLAQNFINFKVADFKSEEFNLMKTIKTSKKFGKVNGLTTLFYVINFKIGDNSEDIVGSKLLKVYNRQFRKFSDLGFNVFLSKFYISMKDGKCLFVYFIESKKIPKLKEVVGPYVHMKNAVDSFINSRDFYFVRDDRMYSYEKRKVYDIDQVLKLNSKDCADMINKDVDFIKKIRVFRK